MSTLRGVVSVAFLGALGAGGYWFYWNHTAKDRKIEEQKRVIADLEKKLDRAWASEMVADVRVDGIRDGADGGKRLDLTFIQYEPGTEIPAFQRSLVVEGEEFYVDALVVTFDRSFVEGADALRGKSLLLFRRAFGDRQRPIDGVPLFRSHGGSVVPEHLQVDDVPTPFEQEIWSTFWHLASDPALAKSKGVRLAQGEAPHVKAALGQIYKLSLRASGGLEITPRIPAAALPK